MASQVSAITTESPASEEAPAASLRDLDPIRPLYFLPRDPFADQVLIPAFAVADRVDCMVGFFSSAILADLAPGLATYLKRPEHKFRLVISPMLSPEDQRAIEEGVKSLGEVMTELMEQALVTVDLLQQHTLRCLAHLLRRGQIDIKIALMEDALFHPKVWLFHCGDDLLAAHGSSNVTYAGIRKNMEQVAASKSWVDSIQRFTTDKVCRAKSQPLRAAGNVPYHQSRAWTERRSRHQRDGDGLVQRARRYGVHEKPSPGPLAVVRAFFVVAEDGDRDGCTDGEIARIAR